MTSLKILAFLLALSLSPLSIISDSATQSESANYEQVEPAEFETVEAPPFPGQPVYVEIEVSAEQEPSENPDGEPVVQIDQTRSVFDHYGDPPPEGTMRLVYVYNYGESKAVLVEDEAEVSKILGIVDSFEPSNYNGGGMLGGYLVEIQAVRDGVHQSYSILSMNHQGSKIAVNGRQADTWYFTSKENMELLMDYFGGIPKAPNKP